MTSNTSTIDMEKMRERIDELKISMYGEMLGEELMRCSHCNSIVRARAYCSSCHTSVEKGIPVCKGCKQEKLWSDNRYEYFCPWCEDES